MASLTWSRGPRTSRVVRGLLYAAFGLLGGYGMAFALFIGVVAVQGNLTGMALLVAGLLGVVILKMTGFDLARRYHAFDARLWREFGQVFRWLWFVLASILGAALLVGAVVRLGDAALLLPFVGGTVLILLAYFLSSDGEIDPQTRMLVYQGEELALDDVVAVRRISVGDVLLLWLTFERGTVAFGRWRWILLPTGLGPTAEQVVESGIAHEANETRSNRSRSRVILAGGVGTLGVSFAVYVVIARAAGSEVAALLATGIALFGVILVILALSH